MIDKNSKVVKINESKLVDLINDIVEKTIVERNLTPATNVEKKPKKITVTEAQLRELQSKGAKINSIVKKKSLIKEGLPLKQKVKEAPTFGGQKVSQDQYDELQHDKGNIEKAMTDAFKTPDGYEMKNYIEIGGTYNTEDGDTVKVVGETPEGHIRVVLTHGQDTIDQYKKWGLPAPPPLKIAWSKVQFDTIMGQMDDHNESQYQGERHGY